MSESRKLSLSFATAESAGASDSSPGSDISGTEARMRRALGVQADAGPQPEHKPLMSPFGPRFAHDRGRRRFVQDGEVPVVLSKEHRGHDGFAGESRGAGAPSNRLQAAETALREERQARANAERLLAEAQSLVRSLQTQLGHAGLAANESNEVVTGLRTALHESETRLAEAETARDAAVQSLESVKAALSNARRERADLESALQDAIAANKLAERRPRAAAAPRAAPRPAPRPAKAAKPRVAATAGKTPQRRATARTGKPESKPVKWWIKSTTTAKSSKPRGGTRKTSARKPR